MRRSILLMIGIALALGFMLSGPLATIVKAAMKYDHCRIWTGAKITEDIHKINFGGLETKALANCKQKDLNCIARFTAVTQVAIYLSLQRNPQATMDFVTAMGCEEIMCSMKISRRYSLENLKIVMASRGKRLVKDLSYSNARQNALNCKTVNCLARTLGGIQALTLMHTAGGRKSPHLKALLKCPSSMGKMAE